MAVPSVVRTNPSPIVPIIAEKIPFWRIGCLFIFVNNSLIFSIGLCKWGNTNSFILIFRSLNCSDVVSNMWLKSSSIMPSAPRADALILRYSSKFCIIGLRKFKSVLFLNISETLNTSPPVNWLIKTTISSIGSLFSAITWFKNAGRFTPYNSLNRLTAIGEVIACKKLSKFVAASGAEPAPFIATWSAAPNSATAGTPLIPSILAPAVKLGNAADISFNSNLPSFPAWAKISIVLARSFTLTFKLSVTENAVFEISTISACAAVAVRPITFI